MLLRLLIITALIAPSSAVAERQRKNSVNGGVQRLIQGVQAGWVDFKAQFSDSENPDGDPNANGGQGDGSNSSGTDGNNGGLGSNGAGASGSGSGSSGSGSGSGSGADNSGQAQQGSGADGSAANVANQEIGLLDGQADPQQGGPGAPAIGGALNAPANGTAFPKMYAMCMFFDESFGTAGPNQVVKGMVDAAARCDVNLVVYPIKVASGSYPRATGVDSGESEMVNELQKASCNIKGRLNISSGISTSICVDDDKMSDQMCQQTKPGPNNTKILDTATAGCAQVQSRVPELANIEAEFRGEQTGTKEEIDKKWEDFLKEAKKHSPSFGDNAGNDIAPSIEDREGCTASIANHEAIGHSMFGHPNGKGDGNGIGVKGDNGDDGQAPYWTPSGCAAMFRNAIDNPGGKFKYDPNRTTYYTGLGRPLPLGEPIFKEIAGIPPGGPVTQRPPMGPPGGRVSVVTQDLPPKNGSGSRGRTPTGNGGTRDNGPAQPDGTDIPVVDQDGRHRKPSDRLLDGLGEDPDLAPDTYATADGAPESGGGSGSARIGFNDSAKKRKPGAVSGNGGGGGPVGPKATSPGPTLFGEDATVGEDSFADSGSAGAGGFAGGASGRVGFDDSAKKRRPGSSSGSNRRPSSVYGGEAGGPGSGGGGEGSGSLVVGAPTPAAEAGNGLVIDRFDPLESSLGDEFFEALGEKERRERQQRQNWRRGADGPAELRPRVEDEPRRSW